MMANVRDSARTFGKSDPIDALAVARASLREPGLPVACLDGPEREVRLLTDLRESLISQRTAAVNRLRWRLHELDPDIDPSPRSLDRASNYDKLETRIAEFASLIARLARRDIADCRRLTIEINELEEQLRALIELLAPSLLELVGCGTLTAAKLVGETGGVTRFKSGDAFARHNGTAPLPVWSSNHQRHRLSRTGNRQINAALHRIAITQIRVHQPAKDLYARRKANGDGGLEAIRVLKRHLSNTVYRALLTEAETRIPIAA